MNQVFDIRLCETFTAPTNIAVIKYWGKDNVKLNTPLNSSVSVTLDQSDLHTITTIAASKNFTHDRLWLNGKEIEINSRGQTCLAEIRKLAQDRIDKDAGEVIVAKQDWPEYHLHICSINTFPTGAGLASSAAGLACFVTTLAKLYNVQEKYPGHLSSIARQGSGSASRSLYGGFVRWQKGVAIDGSDSIAIQVADENYWKNLCAVILVVSDKEKDTSSTAGMETSRATSSLLHYRASTIVNGRLAEIEKAYLDRDFQTFGKITMQDSNQFHATCLDTYPPIFYLNDISRMIIRMVHVINDYFGCIKAAYTFDAGPNAVLYTLDDNVPLLLSIFGIFFPSNSSSDKFCNDSKLLEDSIKQSDHLISKDLMEKLHKTGRSSSSYGDIKYIFSTKVGSGPVQQPREECLLDVLTGLPLENISTKHSRLVINQ